MLLHEFYPNDIRVSKEVKTLIGAGFEIHLLCLGKKGEQKDEMVNGTSIHRIPIAQTFFWRGIWDILLSINFLQPFFYKKLKQLHKKEQFSAFHVHDLPLAKTAIKLSSKFPATKTILDLHENYPEALKVWFQWKQNPIIRLKNRIFFDFNHWLKYERSACQKADEVIVVVDEMKERLISIHQINPEKISVVTNTESQDFLKQERIEDIYERKDNDFILAYTGGVGPHRGIDTAIKALKHLDYPEIRIEITGSLSSDSEQWLTDLAQTNGVLGRVVINGYQPFHKFFSYMAYADVNLIPHNRNGHTDHTIPHKLFQGMMVAKPVIVSDAPPLKRVVETIDSGLVFQAGNAEDFAKKIEVLFLNKEKREELGINGFKATNNGKFSWEFTSKELVRVYKSLTINSNIRT